MPILDATHDPALASWIASANSGASDFPVQNLPHGVFRRRGSQEAWRGGVAIGDQILDMTAAEASGVFDAHGAVTALAACAAAEPTLNKLMALGQPAWRALRRALSTLLSQGAREAATLASCLVPQAEAEHALPARVGNYTDFFTSWHHMVNAGRIFQPDAPPLPNFKWLPIAYHGRASSIEVGGSGFHRPHGQIRIPPSAEPVFEPTRRLDYELEFGCWVGPGNRRGEPIAIDDAEQHLFGLSLLNDWSARDVQAWEAMPLGPFLAKNFLTTVSPWIVTMEALAPFRCPLPRDAGDPPLLPNLSGRTPACGYDLQIEAWLSTPRSGVEAMRLSRSSFRHGHWSLAQMLTHHTEGGCNLLPGDLLGTGTQSGPEEGEQGCLLELSLGGRRPVMLPNGEQRTFLEDGDTLSLRAWGQQPGGVRIGFGECTGTVWPALA